MLGCKKRADTQLRAQARGRFHRQAFIENQYEDFAGIKTDGSKSNILFVIEIPFIEKIFWKIVALNVIVFMLQNVNKGKGTEEIDFFKSLKKK